MGKERSRLQQLGRFSKHVKSCRKARGLTQEVLAERSGLSTDTIRRLEQTAFSPSLDTICKICEGLGLSLSTLFISLELGLRNVPRELADAADFLAEEELRALLQFLSLLRERWSEQD